MGSKPTCGKTPTTVTSSEQEQRAFSYRNTISKKAHTATVRYTWEALALQSTLARFSHIIC